MKRLALILIVLLTGLIIYNEGDKKIVYNLIWHDCPTKAGCTEDRVVAMAEVLPKKEDKVSLNYPGSSTIKYWVCDGKEEIKEIKVSMKKWGTTIIYLPSGKVEKGREL